MFMHAFDSGGSDTITKNSAAFGTPVFPSMPPGAAITLGIWSDPNGDGLPYDAALLWSATGVTSQEDTDTLVDFVVPGVPVTGYFFVGVLHDSLLGGYPGALDQTVASMNRSYFAAQDAAPGGYAAFDLVNLNNNAYPPTEMDGYGYPSVYLLRAEGSGGLGTNYCTSSANSTGMASTITAAGSDSIAAMDLTLNASNTPSGQPGIFFFFFFFFADTAASVPFGNGTLCAAGTITRLPVVFESGNQLDYTFDFGTYGGSLYTAGASTFFQCWYRDPAGGGAFFNTSDGTEIVFMP